MSIKSFFCLTILAGLSAARTYPTTTPTTFPRTQLTL